MVQERDMRHAVKQLGLYDTDPQEWSLARLQRWIQEAQQLLAQMQPGADRQITELRALVENELDRKKDLLTRMWQ